MNTNFTKFVSFLSVVFLIGMLGCGGEPPQKKAHENVLERMKPKEEDRLTTIMDRSWDNLTYILYGFMNYDNEKIKMATDNLNVICPIMKKRIGPQYQQHKQEWQAQCDEQLRLSRNIRQQFEDQNFEGARNSLRDLVGVCMDCHKVYRKHLLQPDEGDESQ